MNHREFDIIIWGASGFTGRLVAEYLLRQYGVNKNLKWAMGGRNHSKLEKVRTELGNSEIPLVLADSNEMDTLQAMAKRTSVICTTVGPYALYGSNLVKACVDNQTDYCDLAGEVQWIRQMIDQHHEAAKSNGTRIVNCCGFDSIPSDMGVYFLQQEAKSRKGEYCQHIKLRVKALKGGPSGGTYYSLSNVMAEAAKDKSIYKTLFNPYGLNPRGEDKGPDGADLDKVVFDPDADAWISPFIMAAINTKVVRRSHALMGFPYGRDFRYDEALLTGEGLGGRAKAYLNLLPMGVMMMAKPNSLLKKAIDHFMPQPGEGPSKEERENGFFNLSLIGKFKDGSILRGKVTGDKDPGYGSTSKMLGESAVCLAKDKAKTPDVAGVLTPAVAMRKALLKRLQEHAGLQFLIKE